MNRRSILIVGLALVLVAAIAGYIYWTRTPQYSLRQIRHALDTHDLASFEKHVDVESVSTRLIDDMLASTFDEGTGSGGAGLGSALAAGMIQLMKPRLVQAVRDQTARLVETGSFSKPSNESAPADSGGGTLEGLSRGVGAEKGSFHGVKYVRKQGKIALVGLAFRNAQLDTSLVLELKMRDEGDHWQLVEFANVIGLVQATRNLRTARLAELNEPIRQEIARALTVPRAVKRNRSDSWGIAKYVDLALTVHSAAAKTVTEFEATVHLRNRSGATVREVRIRDSSPIAPSSDRDGVWSFDVNMFDSSDQALYDLPAGAAQIEVVFDRIVFEDGSELKVHESLEEAQHALGSPEVSRE